MANSMWYKQFLSPRPWPLPGWEVRAGGITSCRRACVRAASELAAELVGQALWPDAPVVRVERCVARGGMGSRCPG